MRSRADPGSVTGSVGGVALFGMRERDAVHSVSMAFVSVWIYRSSEDRRVKGPDEFLSSLTDPGDCQRMSLDLGASVRRTLLGWLLAMSLPRVRHCFLRNRCTDRASAHVVMVDVR